MSTGNDEKLQARLRKLMALAERGEGGEKQNAQRMLDKMLERHGLTIHDLTDERREIRWFPAPKAIDQRLAGQIMAKVCGTSKIGLYTSKGRPKQIGVEVTPAEAVEFEIHYDTLRKALAEHFEDAFSAFVQANKLFAPPVRDDAEVSLSARDFAVLQMASAITPTSVHQRLERKT